MNIQKSITAGIALTLLLAVVHTGCSDSFSPVTSMHDSKQTEAGNTPDYKEVILELGLDIHPLSEVIYSASDLSVVYFTSIELIRMPAFATYDDAEYCKGLSIETDYPGDIEFTDCRADDLKAGKFVIRNNSKERVQLIAIVKARSLFGISGSPK